MGKVTDGHENQESQRGPAVHHFQWRTTSRPPEEPLENHVRLLASSLPARNAASPTIVATTAERTIGGRPK